MDQSVKIFISVAARQSESLALVHGSEIFFSSSEVASTGAGDGRKRAFVFGKSTK